MVVIRFDNIDFNNRYGSALPGGDKTISLLLQASDLDQKNWNLAHCYPKDGCHQVWQYRMEALAVDIHWVKVVSLDNVDAHQHPRWLVAWQALQISTVWCHECVKTKSNQKKTQNLKKSAGLQVMTHHSVIVEVSWQRKSVSFDRTLELSDNPAEDFWTFQQPCNHEIQCFGLMSQLLKGSNL